MNPESDWTAIRKDFLILDQNGHGKRLIYFDNAAPFSPAFNNDPEQASEQ